MTSRNPRITARFQFVWWPFPGHWRLWWHPWTGGLGKIYRWSLILGPLEIRRWR